MLVVLAELLDVAFGIFISVGGEEAVGQGRQRRLLADLDQADTEEHHGEVEMNLSQL